MKITLCENQHLLRGIDLPEDDFDSLVRVVSSEGNSRNILEFFTDGSGRQYLRACNYIGVISFADGNTVEILPKYHGVEDEDEIKLILMDMLSVVYRMPIRKHGKTNLGLYRSNPFEFFITLFLDDVEDVVRKGIRSAYQEYGGNERFVRGRMDFMENMKRNTFHLERFYVEYDIYGPDRAENRIIKATLLFLMRVSTDHENVRRIRRLAQFFDQVGNMGDLDTELRSCVRDRNMSDYESVIRWCVIFLRGNNLTIFSGNNVSYTFLLPMDRVFESYIAEKFTREFSDTCDVSIQDAENNLFDSSCVIDSDGQPIEKSDHLFELYPDIVIRKDGHVLIFDTKWKNIFRIQDISSSDLYQMYSYANRYGCRDIVLLYPLGECMGHVFSDLINDIRVWVMFVDLKHINVSMERVRAFINERISVEGRDSIDH